MNLKALSSADARLALSVERFVRHELGVDWRNNSLVIALSGGADSTALLVIMAALREHMRLTLTAAHLDHGLRPESAAEAEAALNLCRRFDIPFRLKCCDIRWLAEQNGAGLEETGRKQRYTFFEEVRKTVGADWILTAHHVGDLAEDMLLRLIRGVSWPALGGMPGKREHILRPLLMLEKSELTGLLQRLNIAWAEDKSNQANVYRRNRIRLTVLPAILEENANFYETARQLWRTAKLDAAYWHDLVRGAIQVLPEGFFLPRDTLCDMDKAARMRAYMEAIRRLGHGQARARTLHEMDKAVEQARHNKLFQLPGRISAEVTGKGVLFKLHTESANR